MEFYPDLLKGKRAIVRNGSFGGSHFLSALTRHGARTALIVEPQEISDTVQGLKRSGFSQDNLAVNVSYVGDETDLEAEVQSVIAQLGGLDILVNNLIEVPVKIQSNKVSPELWNKILSEHLHRTFLACRLAAKRFFEQKEGGVIVNIISSMASTGMPAQAAFAAAHTAVENLTRSLAFEWASGNIRVNTLSVGYIETSEGEADLGLTPEKRSAIEARVPLQRFATWDDICQPLLFLCSDGAKYVTGATWAVDGGIKLKRVSLT